jgi:hypothetical protein
MEDNDTDEDEEKKEEDSNSNVKLTLDRNGFELVQDPVEDTVDFMNHDSIVSQYYPKCER